MARETCAAMLMMVWAASCGGGSADQASTRKTGRRPPGGGRNKTLSCYCLVPKRKNFVSRARTTSLRSVAPPAWGYKKFAGPVSAPIARLLPIMRLGDLPLLQLSEGIQRRRNLQGRSPQME